MSTPMPAYRALANTLREQIAQGRYRDGVRLPTEAELAEEFGLGRQTVRRAFQDLVAEGAVYRVPGRGTFVDDRSRPYLRQFGSIEDLMNFSDDTEMQVVQAPRRVIDLEAAGRLRLDVDAVWRITFVRSHDGVPFVTTSVWWPEEVARLVVDAPEVAADARSRTTMIGLLESRLDEPITHAAQSITVAAADEEIAGHLGCADGHPVLRIDRLYADDRERQVELAVSHFLPEHYTYRVTLRRR